jgi:hypothetical protein
VTDEVSARKARAAKVKSVTSIQKRYTFTSMAGRPSQRMIDALQVPRLVNNIQKGDLLVLVQEIGMRLRA